MTFDEKLALLTGAPGICEGNIPPIERLGFGGMCIQDGPLGVRFADYASVFPAGIMLRFRFLEPCGSTRRASST